MTRTIINTVEPPSHEETTTPKFDDWQNSNDPHTGPQDYISSVVCPDHDCPSCKQ